MISYQIFVDGSCRANGNGGIGIIWLRNGKKVFEYSNRYENTTNNQMELIAIGIALKSIKNNIDKLTIISDSQYALGCIFNPTWQPKKNIKLISHIKNTLKDTQKLVKNPIEYRHTRGHQKDDSEYTKWNTQVDKLAQNESR